jgi:hypothetical protein
MSYLKHSLASENISLGKTVLTLSALGLFAKILKIDLSQLQILGVTLGPTGTALIPGFIGIGLIYTLLAFILARIEMILDQRTNPDAAKAMTEAIDSTSGLLITLVALPVSIIVYSMPYILGLFATSVLWQDTWAVLKAIWAVAW